MAGDKRPSGCLLFLVPVFLTILTTPTTAGFILEGSATSYAQYPRWVPGASGSLDFLFYTTEPEGLLFYTDNGGSYQFFQLTLVEGTARLRYNLGSGTRLVSTGRNLNNGYWHHVRIQRRGHSTDLIVDSEVETHESREYEQAFGTSQSHGHVYFGGIAPNETRLAQSVVALQPRFMGKIKDVVYKGEDDVPRRPEMSASQVSFFFSFYKIAAEFEICVKYPSSCHEKMYALFLSIFTCICNINCKCDEYDYSHRLIESELKCS